jgi:hypothetical protein
MSESPAQPDVPDARVFVTDTSDWEARVKHDADKLYCYSKNPGEDFFHLILSGEIYLTRNDEKFCLRCAVRDGIATTDRLHWQHRAGGRDSVVM